MADAAFFEGVDREADELAAHVRTGCLTMPDPAPLTMFDHVYVEPTPELERQRREFGAYLESFEEASH
jgi:pyruvate dehydrogenase E1 component alpha subunit